MNIRQWHRQVGIWVSLPLLYISITGAVLLWRNKVDWIQPKTLDLSQQQTLNSNLVQPMSIIIEKVKQEFPEQKIDQIIFRPSKNNISVRLEGDLEVQMNATSGEIVKSQKRYTSWLIEIHQGSYLGVLGQNGLHFAVAISLLFLIYSGIKIFFKLK